MTPPRRVLLRPETLLLSREVKWYHLRHLLSWFTGRLNGYEPEFTSHDMLCLLNTTDQEVHVEITLFYADREPVGPYRLRVASRRARHVRLNDLIDPEAIPLDTDYASVIESNVPIVVQFSRRDTSQAENAILSTMAFPVDAH